MTGDGSGFTSGRRGSVDDSVETIVTRAGLGWSLDCSECGRILSGVNQDAARSRERGHRFARHETSHFDGTRT